MPVFHVNYSSKNSSKPVSVTKTNTSTWKTTTTKVWWSSWWSSSSNKSTWTYRWAWWTWTGTDYASKFGNSAAYKSAVAKYWANNVHDALDYISTWWWSKSQINFLLSWWGSINPWGHINYNANGSQLNWPRDAQWFATGISGMQFWQWTSDEYQKQRNNALWKYYSALWTYDYNTIYNDLSKNKWFAAANANDQKATVNRIMELAANASWWTLTWKSEEQLAAELYKDNNWYDEVDNALNDIYNEMWEFDYYDEGPDMNEQLYPDWYSNLDDRLTRFEESQKNTLKKSVPEERDTSYDYNTYWQENLAPDNNYENWVSKNEKANETWLTFKEKYEDPITQSLSELWLLTPNEQAATQENVEEQVTPMSYNNPEEIVSSFSEKLNDLQQNPEWASREQIVNLYKLYKKQLYEYAKRNKLTNEQYQQYLWVIRNNEALQNSLKNNNQQ